MCGKFEMLIYIFVFIIIIVELFYIIITLEWKNAYFISVYRLYASSIYQRLFVVKKIF